MKFINTLCDVNIKRERVRLRGGEKEREGKRK
jgi:hypothetical protein